jgi:hypothetical protein
VRAGGSLPACRCPGRSNTDDDDDDTTFRPESKVSTLSKMSIVSNKKGVPQNTLHFLAIDYLI